MMAANWGYEIVCIFNYFETTSIAINMSQQV